jgi:hypothetical protein
VRSRKRVGIILCGYDSKPQDPFFLLCGRIEFEVHVKKD